jgi:hypothetical protein
MVKQVLEVYLFNIDLFKIHITSQSLDFWSRRGDLRGEEALIFLHSGLSLVV